MSTAETPRPVDALDMLAADHRAIEALFDACERAERGDFERRNALVQRACELLTIHSIVEEELLYPVAQNALPADRRVDVDVDEAYVEHFLVKTLIERIANLKAGDDAFDATFKVLRENVMQHIEEEESVLFPEVRKTPIDLAAMGAKLDARKAALHERIAETAPAH
ncbi:cation-binding protein [Caballeronia fortuita]|uniref:Cation-binding protein n=1 Tax=Caballeronia fortuita TaxID=1777138 RepID=A0A158D0L4_9BURK|nr:hemerythrin domain-containing protein [Caballeronia fortuita]SAK88194.1 cation-binding protein [Caballeronia fortuita]